MATTRDRKRIGGTPPLGVAFRILYFSFVLAIVILEFPRIESKIFPDVFSDVFPDTFPDIFNSDA